MNKFKKRKFIRPSFLGRPNYKSIGYTKTIKGSTTNEAQVAALHLDGCNVVFNENAKSRAIEFSKTKLHEALTEMHQGDELVITKLEQLGSKRMEIIARVSDIHSQGKHLRTLDGQINTRKLGRMTELMLGLISGITDIELTRRHERNTSSSQQKINPKNIRGRPKTSQAKKGLVLRLRNECYSYRSIKEQTGLALSTIRRIIVEGQARSL